MPLANASDYPILLNVAIFLVAALFVWHGGTRLTHYLDDLAVKTGLGQAFVGMLLLGGITSLPEVANVVTASATGNPGLAINNVLGSAAINVLLLAIVDAFVGRDAVSSAVAKPATLMMATLCILVLIVVALAIVAGDVHVFGVGAWSLAICLLSVGSFWLAAGYDARSQWVVKDVDPAGDEEGESVVRSPLRRLVIRSAIAGAVIFGAGFVLSQIGDALAEQTGIGTGMVGFVLIGFSTSMPELSSIVIALRIRRYEMAFGQVLGTNFVNLSLILLADAVFRGGPVINELSRFESVSALIGAVLIAVFLVGLLERRNPTVMKMGWDSLAVMLLFGGGIGLLYLIQ